MGGLNTSRTLAATWWWDDFTMNELAPDPNLASSLSKHPYNSKALLLLENNKKKEHANSAPCFLSRNSCSPRRHLAIPAAQARVWAVQHDAPVTPSLWQ